MPCMASRGHSIIFSGVSIQLIQSLKLLLFFETKGWIETKSSHQWTGFFYEQ
mgnify:CR=1 FL=1